MADKGNVTHPSREQCAALVVFPMTGIREQDGENLEFGILTRDKCQQKH